MHAVHDGVQSLYTGVGRVAQNVRWTFGEIQERAFAGLGAALHLVTVAYPRACPVRREDLRAESLDIVKLFAGTLSEVPTPDSAVSASEVWGDPGRWRRAGENAADRVREIARGYERTVVFAHDIMFASLLPALVNDSADRRIQVVWVPHSTARIHRYGEIDDERERIEWETAAAIREGTGAFAGAVGKFMAAHLNVAYGIPRSRIVLFRNGIVRSAPVYPRFVPGEAATLLEAVGVPRRHPLVLFFGRCIPHKGVDLLLDAFERHRSAAHLLLVAPPETGSAEYTAEVAARTAALGDRATGVFRFDAALPFAALSSPDTVAVVVPSRADPCPLSVMEAKLYANVGAFVIITSTVDGLAEQAVSGGTKTIGLDADEIAVAIEHAVSAPMEERRQMALSSHRSLDSWDFAKNHAEGLRALLGKIQGSEVTPAGDGDPRRTGNK